eukprot:scaffold199829_cov65-Attheya_sp.AAC.1
MVQVPMTTNIASTLCLSGNFVPTGGIHYPAKNTERPPNTVQVPNLANPEKPQTVKRKCVSKA